MVIHTEYEDSMKHKLGSNQHVIKQKYAPIVYGTLIILTLLVWIIGREYTIAHPVKSPCADTGCFIKVVMAEEPVSNDQQIDEWVDMYAEKFSNTRYEKNRIKALTHYLLLREQNYGGSDNCGDSGNACGPMQFWASTYEQNRNDMIRKGLAFDFGSRLDMEDSIETAIYMFSIGQAKQWGPVYRDEIKL